MQCLRNAFLTTIVSIVFGCYVKSECPAFACFVLKTFYNKYCIALHYEQICNCECKHV